MRRTIEAHIIFLRQDCKMADSCKSIREQLLESITDKKYFSEELAAYFVKEDANKPFAISSTDPSQVAVLKKILNSLEHTEKVLRAVENLDVSRDRYTAGVIVDAAKISYHAINELYSAIQLLNHSNSDIQTIVGPHFKALMPQIAVASKALGQLTPGQPEESAGILLASAVKMLPTEKQSKDQSLESISNLIFEIPHYLEELQKLVSTGASGIATKSITSGEEYQAAMLKKANATKAYFDKLLSTNNKISSATNYLSIVRKLTDLSSDLVNTAAPLTKQAYLDAAEKLQDIKHKHLPQIISELDKMEESMGLKPGVLTAPVIKKMNEYYTQLATQVDNIAKAAGVLDDTESYMSSELGKDIRFLFFGDKTKLDVGEKLAPVPDLLVLQDEQFNTQRRAYQSTRLSEARFESGDTRAKDAANSFFNRLSAYNKIHQTYCKWSLANISADEKSSLIKDYKQFQSHFAALHPDIDKLIVDALTKPSGSGIVSRLYSSEYKQLWGSNHFTQVLSCKEAVLASIDQSVAQAQFKEKLIEKSMSHSEQAAYEARNKKTSLETDGIPFIPIESSFEENKPSTEYYKKVLALSNQIIQLERAQKGANDFIHVLSALASTTTNIASLDELTKENLSKAYKKFQPQFIAMGYGVINAHIVQSLGSSNSTTPPLRVDDLMNLRDGIHTELAAFLSNAKQGKAAYLEQEKAAKLIELERTHLVAQDSELEKRTLFGMLQDMKLSKSVDAFFTGNFQNYLKENLSDVVWKELSKDGKLDTSKLPYLEFHKDSPDVQMYKKLINSVYHIKTGLEKLESINDFGDPGNIVNRTRFLMGTFNALLFDINSSKYYLTQAAENPGLKAIVKESLDLLAPMRNLPLIGDYLKPSEPKAAVEAEKDFVAIWNAQQELVRSFFSPSSSQPEPETVIESLHEENGLEPSELPKTPLVQIIAKALYNIPLAFEQKKENSSPSPEKQQQAQANIQSFVEGLDGLSFGPNSVKKILSALSTLQIQLSEIGVNGRDATLVHLKEIRSELGFIFMAAADEAEFNLGLKPGTYSSIVSDRFNLFYESLISNMPLEKDQFALELIVDVTHMQKRVQREEERRSIALEDKTAKDTKEIIFGKNFEEENKVFNAYKQLKELMPSIKDCDRVGIEQSVIFSQLRNKANEVYQEIQPLLAKANPKFLDEDFISRCDDEVELSAAIDQLFVARDTIYTPSTALTQIQQLLLDSDFSQTKDQEQFIKNYQKLQPYLSKVNYTYDSQYFLRELQTPEDFFKAATRVSAEVVKLQELIGGLEKAKASKISLAAERITYFNDLLAKQIKVIGPQKIEAFKDKVFNNYVLANVESALAVTMGPHAALFMKQSMPDFLAKKEEIFEGLNFRNDIEEQIAARIDSIVPEIIAKNTDSFKQLLFNTNVNTAVKESFKEALGIYTDVFFKKIAPIYEAEKERIISDLPLDKNLDSAMLSQLKSITSRVVEENKDLKAAFSKLNTFVKDLNQLIKDEQEHLNKSAARSEKIILLSNLQKSLSDTSRIPTNNTLEHLQQTDLTAQKELSVIKENDTLIHIDDALVLLNIMIEAENTKPQGNPCRDEKIDKLINMRRLLLEDYAIPKDNVVNFLAQRQQNITAFAEFNDSIPQHDTLIELHDLLSTMKDYVSKSAKLSIKVKTEQNTLLNDLQSKLIDTEKLPSERLVDVKTKGLSLESQKILSKNSDGPWASLCNFFKKILVNLNVMAPTPDETKEITSSFKEKLRQIKNDSKLTQTPPQITDTDSTDTFRRRS